MSNKLFLVCPFSDVENFLRNEYGENIFFITSIAAIFEFKDPGYLSMVKHLITEEGIDEIIIVNDTSCRFIRAALNNESGFGTHYETIIRQLIDQNMPTINTISEFDDKVIKLEELNIKRQAEVMRNNHLFGNEIINRTIHIGGLITNKTKNHIINIDIQYQKSLDNNTQK